MFTDPNVRIGQSEEAWVSFIWPFTFCGFDWRFALATFYSSGQMLDWMSFNGWATSLFCWRTLFCLDWPQLPLFSRLYIGILAYYRWLGFAGDGFWHLRQKRKPTFHSQFLQSMVLQILFASDVLVGDAALVSARVRLSTSIRTLTC